MRMFSSRVQARPDDLAARASDAQRRRNWAEAHTLWSEVTRQRPELLNGWLQLGNMSNELGRYDAALAAFARAAAVAPLSVEPAIGTAGVLERAGRWEEAHDVWQTAALRLSEPPDRDKRTHSLLHAALASLQSKRDGRAAGILALLEQLEPSAARQTRFRLMRARALRHGPAAAFASAVGELRTTVPADPGEAFEVASVLLETGEQEAGLRMLVRAIEQRPNEISFLWLAADLNERLGRFSAVVALCDRMRAIEPDDDRYLRRGFAAAVRGGNLPAARRLAAELARTRKAWDLVHDLIEPYRADGQLDRARLLCRWLRRIWPHSRWHQTEYILLTALSRSADEADRLVRNDIARHGRGEDILRTYADIAFQSGNYMEAVRRLRFFLENHPDDQAASILLGYATANAIGFAEADLHFAAVATRQFQSRDALVGLAHMAMRRRDRDAIYERWLKVVGVHPDHDIGHVELARSAYELRRLDLTDEICRRRLQDAPDDITMGEFFAWFLVATGRFKEAWELLQGLRHRSGSWSVVDLLVQTSSHLNRLDRDLPDLLSVLPQSTTREAGRRLYHVIRSLHVAGRDDLMGRVVDATVVDPDHLGWLWPYLRKAGPSPAAASPPPAHAERDARVKRAWAQPRARVRDDLVNKIRDADAAAIARIVGRPRHEQPVVNIVNKFEQISGGSELHALDIAERVARYARVALWAPEMPHPHFTEHRGVKAIEPAQGHVPHGGVLVLIGVYFPIAAWLAHARPERVIFLYNTFEAPLVFQRVREVWERCGVRTELLFCSDMMGAEVGLPGLFEPSPTDIEAFSPDPRPRAAGHRFTLGRHSRDVIEKHHPEDWKIYRAVAEHGGRSVVLGGTCMSATFPAVDGLELLPARSGDMVPFLRSLDCYYYRTSSWIEPWGRVVVEAMACGLPVVASRNGGYAQIIRHGHDGLLFDTTEEAEALIRSVCDDPALRERLGRNARTTAEALLGDEAMQRLVAFYLVS